MHLSIADYSIKIKYHSRKMKNLGLLLLYVTSLSLLVSSKDISSLIPESRFNEMLKHRNDQYCEGGFYTYTSFIEGARWFNGFATTGDTNTRKREIAAFFAHTSYQSAGGWGEKEPKDKYAWGYCKKYSGGGNHPLPFEYCRPSIHWPCAQDKSYHPRGLFAITGNENYGQAGEAIGADLLGNPDLVNTDPTIAFKTALWVWMTPQSPKPSSHDVITRKWTPCESDKAAGRIPGFGLTTNIITLGNECRKDYYPAVDRRIGFYKRYCRLLGVSPGANLDCYKQKPFA